MAGDVLGWTSTGRQQGTVGSECYAVAQYSASECDNGCAPKGTCGLPYSARGLGGGWELCFA
eukprot:COSAG04_NODE_3301_length_2959_cov_1.913287_2_plen_62_part_00